MYPEVAEQSHQ